LEVLPAKVQAMDFPSSGMDVGGASCVEQATRSKYVGIRRCDAALRVHTRTSMPGASA
jgi:hypothetical protein